MIQSIIIVFFSIFSLRILLNFRGASKEQLDRVQLTDQFRSFDIKLLFGFFLLIPANIVILTYLLTQLSNIGFSSEPLPEFIIRPNMGTWIVISMMLSLAIAVITMILLVKRIKKGEDEKYWKYYNLKYGFNATGVLKYLSILIILFTSLLAISQMNSYVKFYDDSIVINKPLDFIERRYDLIDISNVIHYLRTVAPNGKIVDKPHYGIEFSDGFFWRTNDDLRTPNINDVKIFDYLLKRTNLELTQVEIDIE